MSISLLEENKKKKCLHFLESKLYVQKIHQDIFLPTSVCDEKTLIQLDCQSTILGFSKGAKKQLRCPQDIHVRIFDNFQLAHRDCHTPNNLSNAIKHLIDDVFFKGCVIKKLEEVA
jgi:hypothetical protein